MEMRHLTYFVAIAEEGNVTRAAVRLGMQQPPLSQQLRALERELGTALFQRLPRGMALTPAGAVFLEEARAILDRSAQSIARTRLAASGQVGRITLGVTTSASLHPLIPDILGRYHRAHPAVALDVREANASDLTEALARGELDAAFLRVAVSQPLGLVFEELLRERFTVVLPDGHAMAGRRLSLARLRDEKFILVRRPAAAGMYAQVLQSCRVAGFEPVVAAEVGRMLTALGLVAAGLGVTLVPKSVSALRLAGVRYAALTDGDAPQAPLTLAHRAEERRPVVTGLIGIARDRSHLKQ